MASHDNDCKPIKYSNQRISNPPRDRVVDVSEGSLPVQTIKKEMLD